MKTSRLRTHAHVALVPDLTTQLRRKHWGSPFCGGGVSGAQDPWLNVPWLPWILSPDPFFWIAQVLTPGSVTDPLPQIYPTRKLSWLSRINSSGTLPQIPTPEIPPLDPHSCTPPLHPTIVPHPWIPTPSDPLPRGNAVSCDDNCDFVCTSGIMFSKKGIV